MKQPVKPPSLQFNLPLLDLPALAVPQDKQRELALTLVELLISKGVPPALPGWQ